MSKPTRLKAVAAGIFLGAPAFSLGQYIGLSTPNTLVETDSPFLLAIAGFVLGGLAIALVPLVSLKSARKNALSYLATGSTVGTALTFSIPWEMLV